MIGLWLGTPENRNRGQVIDAPLFGLVELYVRERGVLLHGKTVEVVHDTGQVFALQIECERGVTGDIHLALNDFKDGQRRVHRRRTGQGNGVVARACGKSQAGDRPDTCSRGQTLDRQTLAHDCTCTQKTHAGHDLCTQTGRVRGCAQRSEPDKQEVADHHGNTRAQRNQHVRTHTRRTVVASALDAYDDADQHRAQHAQNRFKITEFF